MQNAEIVRKLVEEHKELTGLINRSEQIQDKLRRENVERARELIRVGAKIEQMIELFPELKEVVNGAEVPSGQGILASDPTVDLTVVGNLRPTPFSIGDDVSMDTDIFQVDDGVNSIREQLLSLRVASQIATIVGNFDRLQALNMKIQEMEFILGGPANESNQAESRPRPMSMARDI